MPEEQGDILRSPGWLAGGAAAFLVPLLLLFLKEQTDISSINQRENDHYEALDNRLKDLKREVEAGRQERLGAAIDLGKRIDTLNDSISQRIEIVDQRLNEIQRQTSAIEGKLGESTPSFGPLKKNGEPQ